MNLDASCQRCGRSARRGRVISHGPGCDLALEEAGCLEADLSRPCRFLASCHEPRRRQQVHEGLRGAACWAFLQRLDQPLPSLDPDAIERAAIAEEGR